MKNNILYPSKALCLAAACLLMLTLMSACSQEEEMSTISTSQDVLRFELFDGGITRAVTDGTTMSTTFELADKAGLYVVKNGQLLKDNVQLTYNVNGFWEPSEVITATDELNGAQFYAYYPYSATATFDASSATPFAAMVAASAPSAKQGSKAEYQAADIMVSSAATIGQYNAVTLPLIHQKAMVCLELPNSSYIFDNPDMEPYVLAKAENAKFLLGETTVTPYFDDASQSYRLIIEPGESKTLTTSFINNGEERSYEATNLAQIGRGQYAKYVIDGGALLVNMTLEVGDFYCADGRIIKKDAETLPNNIVGVVVKTSTTEAIRSAGASWNHGVVVSISEVKAKWGNDKSTTSEQNNAGWKYWYRSYNLADQNGQTSAAKLDESIMAEEGYEVTKAWRAVPQPLEIGGITLDYTSIMNDTMDAWMESYPLPSAICSGWYIPSLGDWKTIESQKTILDTQLTHAGGSTISTDQYWSCNVRGAGSNWCYLMGKTALADRYKGVACNSSVKYRFMLAF
jgi:hypothetical protein